MKDPHFSIKNYGLYQHYKTRNPPWIKLYRSFLNDYEMRRLPVESRLAYIGLLILAAETDNRIPVDYKFISERLGFEVNKSIVTPIIHSGFLLASHNAHALACDALPSSLLSSSEESSLNSSSLPLKTLKTKSKESAAFTSETWEAYRVAYASRYGVDPVRNRQVNSMLYRFVEKLGEPESPKVAAFYVTHNAQWYVSKMHPVNLLLADAEKLRTEWATGTKMTSSAVKNAEVKDNVVEQVKRVEALMKGRTV